MLLWGDNYSIGIKTIDDQHKELFDQINALLISMRNGSSKTEVLKILDFLESYVVKHFDDEEALQKKYNYPGYSLQHLQHEQFKKDLRELRNSLNTTNITALFVIKVQVKICRWWKEHIMNLDKELGKYLLNN